MPGTGRRCTRGKASRKSDPTGGRADVRRLVGGCVASVRSLHAAVSPEPGDAVVGLSVDQINRRFAAACAAAGLEGPRTAPTMKADRLPFGARRSSSRATSCGMRADT